MARIQARKHGRRCVRLAACAAAVLGGAVSPAAASAASEHTVLPGESLTSVATLDGVSIPQLAEANGLSPDSQLIAGSTIQIPGPGESVSGPGGGSSPASTPSSAGSYVVQPGDTLSGIAQRLGTSAGELAAVNGLDPNGLLPAGAALSLGGAAPASASSETGSAAAAPASEGAQPTAETVAPADVGAIAASEGVSPSLAEAIADQESGFNNAKVSGTGAVGVMQIEPRAWSDISRTLAGSPPLSSTSAADNVRAGVLLIRSLLAQTGGDPGMAAAAYYQGLSSVRSIGVLPSTQRYVADVLALQAQFGGP
jgi:LysM repeat protein